jgi:hypothetical protein
MNIQKVSINYDFNFNSPYELSVSPLAEYNKDKIMNQTSNTLSSKDLVILRGNLTSENDYFLIKGKLDENKDIDDKFYLTVYSNTSNLINISCETTNEIYNNFEIKCEKDKSTSINVNNSMSYMDSKLLLVVIEEGVSANVAKDATWLTMIKGAQGVSSIFNDRDAVFQSQSLYLIPLCRHAIEIDGNDGLRLFAGHSNTVKDSLFKHNGVDIPGLGITVNEDGSCPTISNGVGRSTKRK